MGVLVEIGVGVRVRVGIRVGVGAEVGVRVGVGSLVSASVSVDVGVARGEALVLAPLDDAVSPCCASNVGESAAVGVDVRVSEAVESSKGVVGGPPLQPAMTRRTATRRTADDFMNGYL
ncbi:hypothetical protein NDI76_20840 [Halogeometricum sp. S1BR25-6]|uniref:Uncharacterized protein n=1 Tax=Halogeometricum salsisoli TaxID=2950536 RepID=A0ABU2GK40_9EURY|nr:hypothetical protein [Halogeometricum sp. S1BR25-6]MDS0301187.1 hypothetical protein [Halogeometricum sp. S1BR25-6]